MNESILTSVKKKLGINEDYTHFDADLILDINSVFSILLELGVGPSKGFKIEDSSKLWSDYIKDEDRLELVKSYMALKVGMMFDPPLSSAVMEAKNRMISELEWRLNVAAEEILDKQIDPDDPMPGDEEDLTPEDIDDIFDE